MNDVMRELECAIEEGCGEYREVKVSVLKYARAKLLEFYAEIERLQGALKAEERHNELTMECAKKALAEKDAEIERLKLEYKGFEAATKQIFAGMKSKNKTEGNERWIMKKVDGNNVGTFDGIVHIISGDTGKTIYITAMGDESDRFFTLNDCLEAIGYESEGSVIVIIEDLLDGKVYRYGNYADKCWYECGATNGYA